MYIVHSNSNENTKKDKYFDAVWTEIQKDGKLKYVHFQKVACLLLDPFVPLNVVNTLCKYNTNNLHICMYNVFFD